MTATKSLKESNSTFLTASLAGYAILFIYLTNEDFFGEISEFSSSFEKLFSLSAALLIGVIVKVLNGIISPDIKAHLVFWRIHNPLPGSRAFSKHIYSDPRLDPDYWSKVVPPETSPDRQNTEWYRIYSRVRECTAVREAHRSFLFCRDLTCLSVLFAFLSAGAGAYLVDLEAGGACYLIYMAFGIFSAIAGQQYGVRLVTTSLAEAASAKAPE